MRYQSKQARQHANISRKPWQVLATGKKAAIHLQNQHTGELFAEAPIREPIDRYVEPVTDSQRFFVLRVEDEASGSHALLGIGFDERGDAFGIMSEPEFLICKFVCAVSRQVPETL